MRRSTAARGRARAVVDFARLLATCICMCAPRALCVETGTGVWMEGEYRLSDIIKCFHPESHGKGWWSEAFWCAGMRTNASIRRYWPSSIGAEYAGRAAAACAGASGAAREPCMQHALLDVVRLRAGEAGAGSTGDPAEGRSSSADGARRRWCRESRHGRGECVFHLRLGEVFSQINLTAQELWRGQPVTGAPWDFDWGRNGGKGARYYVKPTRYFEEVAKQLPSGTDRIVLLGKVDSLTSGTREFTHGTAAHAVLQSQIYLGLLKTWLREEHGFRVRVHGGNPAPSKEHEYESADCDFVYMATAPCFAPSGGGFGALAANLAEQEGGTVIKAASILYR